MASYDKLRAKLYARNAIRDALSYNTKTFGAAKVQKLRNLHGVIGHIHRAGMASGRKTLPLKYKKSIATWHAAIKMVSKVNSRSSAMKFAGVSMGQVKKLKSARRSKIAKQAIHGTGRVKVKSSRVKTKRGKVVLRKSYTRKRAASRKRRRR